MSLLSTWGKHNRVVSQQLHTTYERELLKNAAGAWYWRYTRTRTKKYDYVGLTEAAAAICAKSMNILYNRRALEQKWLDNGSLASSFYYFDNGIIGQGEHPYNPTPNWVNNVTKGIVCGQGVAMHEAGCAWMVGVDVSETLSFNYRPLNYAADQQLPPPPWNDFENDPTGAYNQFLGIVSTLSENYDTADIGYGSPTT